MGSYLTVESESISEHTVSRSRFIGQCVHVENEDEVNSVLARVKKEYWDAKHHCYAYILGEDSGRTRYSDDGEPGGTAGLPILNAIKSKSLTNTLVVVTRYFGGVLLGTGGLVRAYGKASADAIANASLISMEECIIFGISIPYPVWPKINGYINENCCSVEVDYLDIVRVQGMIKASEFNAFNKELIDRSDGKLHAELLETRLAPIKR